MKRCFTSLTALLCSAAILLCSLPMQALAVEFRMQTAYEDVLPDELTAQKEAPEAENSRKPLQRSRPSPVLSTVTDPAILHTASCPTIPRRSRGIRGRRQI